MIAWAEALGLSEIAEVLGESLAEEKAADEKLSAIAESGINDAATAGESEQMDEEEEESEPMSRATSRKSEPAAMSAKSARAKGGRR